MSYELLTKEDKEKANLLTEEMNKLLRKYGFHIESAELYHKNSPIAFIDDNKTHLVLAHSESERTIYETEDVN
jgi:dipeptidyl aminopeptidase/acylaminoacyl peptidase